MKLPCLLLSLVMTLNSVAFAANAASASDQREQKLLELAKSDNPKQALAQLSDEELLQAKTELRGMISSLQADFAVAQEIDGQKIGYKIRNWGAIGVGTVVLLTVIWSVVQEKTYKGPGVDDPAGVILLLGMIGVVVTGVIAAGGQAVVWLTPTEAGKVKQKISSIAKFAASIDKKLESKQ